MASASETPSTVTTDGLTLTLGGVKLAFENGKWKALSDLDIAAKEINEVMDERDAMLERVVEADSEIADLRKEVIETNNTKKVALEMVIYHLTVPNLLCAAAIN